MLGPTLSLPGRLRFVENDSGNERPRDDTRRRGFWGAEAILGVGSALRQRSEEDWGRLLGKRSRTLRVESRRDSREPAEDFGRDVDRLRRPNLPGVRNASRIGR